MLSTTKYRLYREAHKDDPKGLVLDDIDGDPSTEFNNEFIGSWMRTENFRIFNQYTDEHLFDIVIPEHPCSGGLTMEDVQRRLNAQVDALHLDERFAQGKETLNKHFAEGQKKVSTAFNNLWNDIETMREVQRKKAEEDKRIAAEKAATAAAEDKDGTNSPAASVSGEKRGDRTSTYLSSWSQWASEKRAGWRRSAPSPVAAPLASPTESRTSLASPIDGKASMDDDDDDNDGSRSWGSKPAIAAQRLSADAVRGHSGGAAGGERGDGTRDSEAETEEERVERERTELDEEVQRAREAWGAA